MNPVAAYATYVEDILKTTNNAMPFNEWSKHMKVLHDMNAPYLYDTPIKLEHGYIKEYHPQTIYRKVFEGCSNSSTYRITDKRLQTILDYLTPERVDSVRLRVRLGV